jgi:DNA primase
MQGNKNANLDLIRERLNILDVVSTYIKLDKAGSQFRARCPFHSEKSPSFYVNPSKGFYHCFGCSQHGDIFGFIMKIEGINFKDALKLLADKAGVSLTNFKKEETSSLIDILENTTIFFENELNKSPEAKEYLKKRGVSEETISRFRIGFAPNDWRQLYTKLNKAGYSVEEIVSSGVCIKHEKGLYDRFRSRVMFPVMNPSGKVVAYSGRIIGIDQGKDGVAKYVNSPETPMYHKSSILFGYDKSKQEIAKTKKVLVVEGQMDVVMAHQAGNTNTVAISGTAFTPEHISILKRFAETVVLALDTDKAGYAAMLKSAALALESDMEVEGIKLVDKDPADMILHDKISGTSYWAEAVGNPKPILSLITEIILEKEKIKPRQIQLLRKDLFPLLRVIKSPLLKETYTKDIAKQLDIDISIIKQETESIKSEIELQIKKEKKVIPQIELLTMLAETVSTINIITKEDVRNFYKEKLNKYLRLQNEYKVEEIPEEILNRELIIIEKKIHENNNPDFKIESLAHEVLQEFIKRLISKLIIETKEKMKTGEELELNLKLIQDYTKYMNSLRQDLNYE